MAMTNPPATRNRTVKIPKEYMPIWRKARDQGWDVSMTRGGHLCWTSPDGSKVFCPSTPSDHRSLHNVIRKLKYKGLKP